MRKIIVIIILLLSILAGCSRIESEVSDVSPDTSPEQETPDVAENNEKQEESVGWYSVKLVYANWSEDDRIFRYCLNPETMAISSYRHLPVYKFSTKEDVEKFKEMFHEVFSLDQRHDEVPSFSEVADAYNDDFFTEYSVVMAYVAASSGSFRFDIESVSVEDMSLCLNVYQTNAPEVYTADMAGWFVITELDKDIVDRCNAFDAKLVTMGKEFKVSVFPGFREFGDFSWKETERAIKDLDERSMEHVKLDGFVNTEPITLTSPVDRAKAEADINYTLIQYFHDQQEGMWMVRFFSSEDGSPLEEVYMDENGVTKLILYANTARYDGTGA
ncbi:MAG: hypothetical protein IKG47_08055 [Oscillospiraceae bacterium]|nr:hypothetical protein [Oscillospiraceae bacterium]